MAEDDTEETAGTPPKKKKKEKKKKKSTWAIIKMVIVSLALIVGIQMTFVLLIVGMLPTFVAYYIDVSRSRSTFHTVMACNLSGVLPFVAELIATGNETSSIQMRLSDPEVLLVMYLFAALGWVLVYTMPFLASAIIMSVHKGKVIRHRDLQSKLVQEWGQKIISDSKNT